MIRVLEMDQLDNVVWDYDDKEDVEFDEPEERSDKGSIITFYVKPDHIEAIPALYAYLWYGEEITSGEKAALNALYIDYEGRGRKKFFRWGKFNNLISSQELAAAKQAVKDMLIPALEEMGRTENIPLCLYGFKHIHNIKQGSFAEALQTYGFNFNEKDFTCTDNAIYNRQGFGFFLLPSYQLEMIITRDGETKAFLSNGPLYDNTEPFQQRAVKQEHGANFTKTVRSTFPKMKEAWNKWIAQQPS